MEGTFVTKSHEHWKKGERADIVKQTDNLKTQGEFTKRVIESWSPGERACMVKRSDNLYVEGEFTFKPDVKWSSGDRANIISMVITLRLREILHPELKNHGIKERGSAKFTIKIISK